MCSLHNVPHDVIQPYLSFLQREFVSHLCIYFARNTLLHPTQYFQEFIKEVLHPAGWQQTQPVHKDCTHPNWWHQVLFYQHPLHCRGMTSNNKHVAVLFKSFSSHVTYHVQFPSFITTLHAIASFKNVIQLQSRFTRTIFCTRIH